MAYQAGKYFKKTQQSDTPLILTSQKFFYGPGRYRSNVQVGDVENIQDMNQWHRNRPQLSNYNSVRFHKQQMHKKFIACELFSLSQFSLRFNRFYLEELKKAI